MLSRVLVLLLAGLVGWGGVPRAGQAAALQESMPDIAGVTRTENDCSFLIQFDDDPRPRLGDITCGTLDVPENWDEPDGRRLQIGYTILHSTSLDPEPDPVVYLDGGPGGSPLTGAAMFADLFAGLRASRDVVLFDQRGTRLSSPLRCNALDAAPPDLAGDAGDTGDTGDAGDAAMPEAPRPRYPSELGEAYEILQQARQQNAPAAAACALEILAGGVDLRQYNSIASANDTVALVKTLGYDAYNLYGLSYGTRLALVVMRDHPRSGLRSVILDSSFPPEIKGFESYPQEPHEVVIQLFADCALDAACHAAYPDLKNRFIALLDRLAAAPIVTADGFPIDDRDVAQLMQGLTGQLAAVPYIPAMIAELERGEDDIFAGIATGEMFDSAADDPPLELELELELAEDQGALADPELDTPVAQDAELAADASPARIFLHELQRRIETLPEDEADGMIGALLNLNMLPLERQTLAELVQRAFPGGDREDARIALLDILAMMDDVDVQEVFAIVADTVTLIDFLSFGMTRPQFYSVECNEEIPFQSFENTVAIAQSLEIPELAIGVAEAMAAQFAICEVWPSGRAPALEELAVSSDIPTMIMAGAYDLQTPVSWNKLAFVSLPNGFFVQFPMSGHGTIVYSDCAKTVAAGFIANPVDLPDTSCVATLNPVWVLPDALGDGLAAPVA